MVVPSYAAELCQPAFDDEHDNFVRVERDSTMSNVKMVALGAAIAVAGLLSIGAMAVRSGKGRAILSLLAMASVGKAGSIGDKQDIVVDGGAYRFARSLTADNQDTTCV